MLFFIFLILVSFVTRGSGAGQAAVAAPHLPFEASKQQLHLATLSNLSRSLKLVGLWYSAFILVPLFHELYTERQLGTRNRGDQSDLNNWLRPITGQ